MVIFWNCIENKWELLFHWSESNSLKQSAINPATQCHGYFALYASGGMASHTFIGWSIRYIQIDVRRSRSIHKWKQLKRKSLSPQSSVICMYNFFLLDSLLWRNFVGWRCENTCKWNCIMQLFHSMWKLRPKWYTAYRLNVEKIYDFAEKTRQINWNKSDGWTE